jgi:hypothetical protein
MFVSHRDVLHISKQQTKAVTTRIGETSRSIR